MKLILNSSTIEIVSRERENRNKEVVNAEINSSNVWSTTSGNQGFFIDIKQGDSIVINPNTTTNRLSLAFTSNKTVVNRATPAFANETSGRLDIQNTAYEGVAIENCYLFVLTSHLGTQDFTPSSIIINGLTLDENGWL